MEQAGSCGEGSLGKGTALMRLARGSQPDCTWESLVMLTKPPTRGPTPRHTDATALGGGPAAIVLLFVCFISFLGDSNMQPKVQDHSQGFPSNEHIGLKFHRLFKLLIWEVPVGLSSSAHKTIQLVSQPSQTGTDGTERREERWAMSRLSPKAHRDPPRVGGKGMAGYVASLTLAQTPQTRLTQSECQSETMSPSAAASA